MARILGSLFGSPSSASSLIKPSNRKSGNRSSFGLLGLEATMAAEEEQELDLGNSDVCTKYREAGRIVNLAMQGIKTMVRTFIGLHLKSVYTRLRTL